MAGNYEIKIPDKLLTPEHLAMLQSALAIKDLAQKHLDSAKRVGMDTKALQQTFDDSMAKLLELKREFFPGQ